MHTWEPIEEKIHQMFLVKKVQTKYADKEGKGLTKLLRFPPFFFNLSILISKNLNLTLRQADTKAPL